MNEFNRFLETMSGITEEEQKKTVEAKKALCECPNCPTYNECAKGKSELLYCILGASPVCITEESGCICPACPVWDKTGFKNDYFCTKGTEKEQRVK